MNSVIKEMDENGYRLIMKAIDLYDENNIKELKEIPDIFMSEFELVVAKKYNSDIENINIDEIKISELRSMIDESLKGVKIDYSSIFYDYKMELIDSIHNYVKMKISNSSNIVGSLIFLLNIFDENLQSYYDWCCQS